MKAVQLVCWRHASDPNNVHRAYYRISRAGMDSRHFEEYIKSRRGLEKFRCQSAARLYTRKPGRKTRRHAEHVQVDTGGLHTGDRQQ